MSESPQRLEVALREMLVLERQASAIVERHRVEVALPPFSPLRALLQRIKDSTEERVKDLEQRLAEQTEMLPQHSEAYYSYFGLSPFSLVRTRLSSLGTKADSASGRLCQAHTALSSLSIGYTRLHFSATALRAGQIAELADEHLQEVNTLAEALRGAIPSLAAEEHSEPGYSTAEAPAPWEGVDSPHPHAG